MTIIHHLLVNGERYVEEGFEMRLRVNRTVRVGDVALQDMVAVLRGAGYVVRGPFG